jgi:hypothetical protein
MALLEFELTMITSFIGVKSLSTRDMHHYARINGAPSVHNRPLLLSDLAPLERLSRTPLPFVILRVTRIFASTGLLQVLFLVHANAHAPYDVPNANVPICIDRQCVPSIVQYYRPDYTLRALNHISGRERTGVASTASFHNASHHFANWALRTRDQGLLISRLYLYAVSESN